MNEVSLWTFYVIAALVSFIVSGTTKNLYVKDISKNATFAFAAMLVIDIAVTIGRLS